MTDILPFDPARGAPMTRAGARKAARRKANATAEVVDAPHVKFLPSVGSDTVRLVGMTSTAPGVSVLQVELVLRADRFTAAWVVLLEHFLKTGKLPAVP